MARAGHSQHCSIPDLPNLVSSPQILIYPLKTKHYLSINFSVTTVALECPSPNSDKVAVLVLVQVVVDGVELRAVRTVHIEPPVAHPHRLAEHGTVGAEEAELLAGGQAPVPYLSTKEKDIQIAG